MIWAFQNIFFFKNRTNSLRVRAYWISDLLCPITGWCCLKIHISNVPKLRNTKYTIWTFKNIKSFKNRLSSVKIRACWILDLLSAVPGSGCLKIHVSKVLMWRNKKYTIWTFWNIQNFKNRSSSRLGLVIRSWMNSAKKWIKACAKCPKPPNQIGEHAL